MGMVAHASNLEGCSEFVANLIYIAKPCLKAVQKFCLFLSISQCCLGILILRGKIIYLRFNLT